MERFDYVGDRPAAPSVVIPPEHLRALLCVGYRDKVGYYSRDSSARVDHLLDFMALHPEGCYEKYKWMFPTNNTVNRATLRYNEAVPLDIDPKIVELAFSNLLEMFQPIMNSCKVRDWQELRVNMKSSTGPSFEHGVSSMKYVLQDCTDNLQECWEFAHQYWFPMYWKCSGKIEILKTVKVDSDDGRTFIFPDADHRMCGQRLNQDINDRMASVPGTWSAIGFDRTHGGFTKLGNQFSIPGKKFEGDLKKWDSRMARFAFVICMAFRWCCLHPQFRTRANFERFVYHYYNKAQSLIFSPSGQLLFYDHGNKSGQDSTSYDNTLWHIFLYMYGICELCLENGVHPTLRLCMDLLQLVLYGDDSLGNASAMLQGWLEPHGGLLNWLDALYTKFGMIFKRDECKIQDTVEGLKFLGGVFKRSPYGWAHTFDVNRVLTSMVTEVDKPTKEALWSKWTSLLCLLAFEEERHWIRQHMIDKYQEWSATGEIGELSSTFVPSDHDLYTFWFGWEGPGAQLTLNFEHVGKDL